MSDVLDWSPATPAKLVYEELWDTVPRSTLSTSSEYQTQRATLVVLPSAPVEQQRRGNASAPDWWESVVQQLTVVANLPDNWNGYEERRPSRAAVGRVIAVLIDLRRNSLRKPAISPLADGGLQLDWGPHGEVVAEISPSGEAVAYVDDETSWPLAENADIVQLFRRIEAVA